MWTLPRGDGNIKRGVETAGFSRNDISGKGISQQESAGRLSPKRYGAISEWLTTPPEIQNCIASPCQSFRPLGQIIIGRLW
jgi:hypothetical protein